MRDPIEVPYETMEGPVTTNGLAPNDFWAPASQQALRSLGASRLVGPGNVLVSTSLLDNAGGRSVLQATVRCALPEGQTVKSSSNAPFHGELGLAPEWTSRALNTSEQRWVTACLLQLLNGLGAHVPILLQGSSPALDPDSSEDLTSYTINDTTVFGNVFGESDHGWVCLNSSLISLGCGISWSTHTLQRICGLSPTCGMTLLGLCGLVCSRDTDGVPTTCKVPLGPSYTQVISSKLEESGAISLYPLCVLP